MPTLKYIFFILLVTLVSLFAAKNMHTVEIHFFDSYSANHTIKVPTIVLIAGSFGLGFIIVWFFELFTRLKLKTQLHIKERKIKLLETELADLKQSRELTSQSESSTSISDI